MARNCYVEGSRLPADCYSWDQSLAIAQPRHSIQGPQHHTPHGEVPYDDANDADGGPRVCMHASTYGL
jgi:hypothetical protein